MQGRHARAACTAAAACTSSTDAKSPPPPPAGRAASRLPGTTSLSKVSGWPARPPRTGRSKGLCLLSAQPARSAAVAQTWPQLDIPAMKTRRSARGWLLAAALLALAGTSAAYDLLVLRQ